MNGLALNWMRNGFLTLACRRSLVIGSIRAAVIVSVAPARRFSPSERDSSANLSKTEASSFARSVPKRHSPARRCWPTSVFVFRRRRCRPAAGGGTGADGQLPFPVSRRERLRRGRLQGRCGVPRRLARRDRPVKTRTFLFTGE